MYNLSGIPLNNIPLQIYIKLNAKTLFGMYMSLYKKIYELCKLKKINEKERNEHIL